jgi:hypothetical protein
MTVCVSVLCTDLVLMAAEVDPQQAEEYASRIPAIKADSSINAEALDNLPTPTLSAIKRKEEREGGTCHSDIPFHNVHVWLIYRVHHTQARTPRLPRRSRLLLATRPRRRRRGSLACPRTTTPRPSPTQSGGSPRRSALTTDPVRARHHQPPHYPLARTPHVERGA